MSFYTLNNVAAYEEVDDREKPPPFQLMKLKVDALHFTMDADTEAQKQKYEVDQIILQAHEEHEALTYAKVMAQIKGRTMGESDKTYAPLSKDFDQEECKRAVDGLTGDKADDEDKDGDKNNSYGSL